KEGQAISFQMSGNKNIKKIFANAQYDGLCRAFISEKQAPMSLGKNGFSLAPLIGGGIFQANTYTPGSPQPQTSQLNIVSGEIGEDIAHYLNQSNQIPCVVSLAVKIGAKGKVIAAGGVIIELMPGHSDTTLHVVDVQQSFAKPLSQMIEEGKDYIELLENHLGGIDMDELYTNEIRYHCTCSKEKAASSIGMLPKEDFEDIMKSPESLNVDCEMCGLVYSFSN
ncbi:MAG: Hsp33 family molecular chaperone HslO, partial [Bdellovibrionales bacterium]|nr:Hsp33 family molecular chaperone HslO [Bdellovibrionales bacterium]